MLSLLAKILDCDDFCVLASKNKREKSLCEGNESHACVSRAYQQRFNFFCCHKCHTRREKVKKKMEKSSKRKGRKKCFSLLRYADVEWLNSLSVKIYFRRGCNILGNRYIGNNLWHLWQQKCKNSCNTRILARLRVGILLLFTLRDVRMMCAQFLLLSWVCFCISGCIRNNPSFGVKWRVVL